MRFSLAAVTAFAIADAFLLPAEISAADTDIIKSLPFEDAVSADGRVVEIDCIGCPVLTDIEGKMHSTQVESLLRLDFKLVHDDDVDRLVLNDRQIYPMLPGPLAAAQMIKNDDSTWEYSSTLELGFALRVSHIAPQSGNDNIDLISVKLEIIEVAGVFVSTMPIVEIKLLQTPSYKLMIGDAAIIDQPIQPSKESTGNAHECTTLLCKWRAIFAERLSKFKGCGKAPAAASKAIPAHKSHGHHGRPHYFRPSGSHQTYRHHRHRHGGITRVLRSVFMHVVIPALIGIMVGITASLLGMVVGHTLILLWRVFYRRGGNRQFVRVQQHEIAANDIMDETKGFIDHQGPPPVYEEAVVVEKAMG